MTNDDFGGHATPLTPPQPEQGAPAPDATTSHPISARRGIGAIGITLAIVGGIALAGAGATAALAATTQTARGEDTVTTVATEGVSGIDLDVSVSDMTVRFAPVAEAELRVEDARGRWTLEREGDDLVVRGPERRFGWWFGGFIGGGDIVTLTLPDELAGVDAVIDLSAGDLEVTGDFGELDTTVGAGALVLVGSANSLYADISAGRADLELADVETARLQVSAGKLMAELTGEAPDAVEFDVSAGSLELTVPDEEYDVTQDVSAGGFDNRLDTSSRASRTIDASVSAGSATLRPAD